MDWHKPIPGSKMSSGRANPDILVFYHYFYPDDVVSARHLTDLATGLSKNGCNVEVMPSNRSCRDNIRYAPLEQLKGVRISRVFRPNWNQASTIGRLLNLIWMLTAWSIAAFKRNPDIIIVGTDPILSVLIALPWKLIRPKTKIVHWCFDLYPDAAIETGLLKREGALTKAINWLCLKAYQRCDAIVDIGECMRQRMPNVQAKQITLTPWALAEPSLPAEIDLTEREKVFGDTRLAILYSGNFGEAHSYQGVIDLARTMRDDAVFAFSVRGNRADELRAAVTAQDHNIRFVEFADEAHLEARLACADIHLVTLNAGWEGVVVPSKFFGALAIGRPVLFDGPRDSAVAQWIQAHHVGWHLDETTREELLNYQHNFDESHAVYQRYFSYRSQLEQWNTLLESL